MSTQELKTEIQRAIENAPDEVLNELLTYLRLFQNTGNIDRKIWRGKRIRDRGILESALNRPYATFDKNELYPHATDKAAAILESLVANHPFIDGNKRIGYVMMRLTLLENKLDLAANQ